MTTYINLVSKFDDKGIQNAQKGMSAFGKGLGVAFAAAGAAVAVAGAAIGKFGIDAVNAASAFGAEFEGVNQVFGDSAKAVQDFAKSAAQTVGISETEALQAAKGFGVFASTAGLASGEAADFSTKLVQAAGDLASFNDVPVEEALAAIKSGLQGSGEPLTKFGILMNDATLREEALRQGIISTTKEALTPQQKVLAANALVLSNLGVAQGDFVKYQDTFGNKLKTVTAEFDNMRARVGEQLIPVAEKLLTSFQKILPTLEAGLVPAFAELAEALGPIIEQLAPVLVKLFQTLMPVILALAKSVGPLMNALSPVLDILVLLADAVVEIVEQVLPPLIRVIDVLAPVVLQLVQAFLPLVMDLLPPLIKLFEAMMPVIMILVDYLTNFLIPIWTDLGEFLGFTLIGIIDALTEGFIWLESVLGPLYAAIKPLLDAILQFMGIDPSELRKEIVVDVKVNDAELKKFEKVNFTGTGGTLDFLQGMGFGGAPTVGTTGTGATTGTGTGGGGGKKTDNRKEIAATLKESGEAVKKAQKSYRDTVNKARDTYAKAVASINETYTAAVKSAEETRSKALTQAATDNANAIARINSDTAKKLADIVATSINRLRDAFKGAVQVNVADLFASEDVGKSVDGLVKSLRDRLQGSQQLIANSAKLAAAGFSQTFIEQVVASGVDAGNELATSILTATPETQKELMSLFGELETTSETGMDKLSQAIYDGTGLATTELKKLYADTLSEQTTALAEQATAYTAQQVEIMEAFDLAMQEAADTRDTALADAMKSYQDALKKAMDDFVLELDEVEKKFKEKLDKLKAQKSDIDKLQKQIDGAKNVVPTPIPITPVINDKNKNQNNTTINVNVKTDSTKSDAQVGEDIVKVINKYTNRGGALLTGRVTL